MKIALGTVIALGVLGSFMYLASYAEKEELKKHRIKEQEKAAIESQIKAGQHARIQRLVRQAKAQDEGKLGYIIQTSEPRESFAPDLRTQVYNRSGDLLADTKLYASTNSQGRVVYSIEE